jgi:hypothetical protein
MPPAEMVTFVFAKTRKPAVIRMKAFVVSVS